jgi:hypothetical protein
MYTKSEKIIDAGDCLHVFPNLRHLYHVNDFQTSRNALRANEAPYHVAVVPIAARRAWRWELKRHIAAQGMVVVLPQGRAEARILQPQQVARKFDAEVVEKWMLTCRRHRSLCSAKAPDVVGMRVIDCEAEGLAIKDYDPKTDKYVALSYVWGSPVQSKASKVSQAGGQKRQVANATKIIPILKPESDEGASSLRQNFITAAAVMSAARPVLKLPSDIPLTILDAIEVTKALKYRYLWVDKYCIDQTNPAEQRAQFSRMGDIYGGAQVTIFALGEHSNAGLPGVSSTARLQQRICSVGQYQIISTMPDPHEAIRGSRWSTRGWTYQEGLFSTRRLFFTNHQVYFECNAMNCAETFASKLSVLHVNSGQRFRAYHRAGQFLCGNSNRFSHLSVRGNKANHRKVDIIRQCQMHIRRYSKRELTDKDDILNAFEGVARFYARTTAMIASLAGIAVPFPIARLPSIEPESLGNLSYALAWAHAISNFDADFPRQFYRSDEQGVSRKQHLWTPYDNPKPQRRPGFPSWSWVGWFGVLRDRKDLPYFWTGLLSAVRIGFPHNNDDGEETRDYAWMHGVARYKPARIQKLLTARSLEFDAYVLSPEKLIFWEDDPHAPLGRRMARGVYVHMSSGPRSLEALHEKQMTRKLECVVLGTYGAPRAEVFRAIQAADRKSPQAARRRIDLFERGEPDVVACLVVATVRGVSYRVGLLRLRYHGAGGKSAIQEWNPGMKRRFVLK